jgi:hypothetical protein
MNCGEFSKFLYTFETQLGEMGGAGGGGWARSQVLPLLSNRKMEKTHYFDFF